MFLYCSSKFSPAFAAHFSCPVSISLQMTTSVFSTYKIFWYVSIPGLLAPDSIFSGWEILIPIISDNSFLDISRALRNVLIDSPIFILFVRISLPPNLCTNDNCITFIWELTGSANNSKPLPIQNFPLHLTFFVPNICPFATLCFKFEHTSS